MKRILISSTDVMMYLFLLPHVKYLANKNYHIDVACSSADEYKAEGYEKIIHDQLPKNSRYFHIASARSPYSSGNIKGYRQLRAIINDNDYDLVWTNEPVMGVITRLAASKFRKNGLKVLYLAHGYHFFKGAPTLNWIYYPVEKFCSYLTDLMVMINLEDFDFTKRHFSGNQVRHIDGIGFDVSKYDDVRVEVLEKRKSLGVGSDDILVLSAGELMTRKNHEVMIEAIAQINDPRIKYVICGIGDRLEFLKDLANKLGIRNKVSFVGLRYDIPELLKVADIFAHPSKREGLGIAPLEAMASGLPIVTSNIQGIKDYSVNGLTGFSLDPTDIEGFSSAICKLVDDAELRKKMGEHNIQAVRKWSIENSTSQVERIIHDFFEQ
jgi:glycosyltransferase EpsD